MQHSTVCLTSTSGVFHCRKSLERCVNPSPAAGRATVNQLTLQLAAQGAARKHPALLEGLQQPDAGEEELWLAI